MMSTPMIPVQSFTPRVTYTPLLPQGQIFQSPYTAPANVIIDQPPSNAPTPVWPPEQPPLPPVSSGYAMFFTPAPPVFEAGTFPAQPLGTHVPVRLHHHIIINPVDPEIPVLQWDVIHAAELAKVLGGRGILIPLDLNAAAVTGGFSTDKMHITADAPCLKFWMNRWGPIVIEKPDIKVRDVLDAIHDYFQLPLTEDDVTEVERVPGNKANLRNAALYRIRDSYDSLPPLTAQSGYRRSDILGGERRFKGLRVVVFDDGTWTVFLGLMPGPVPNLIV
ncbi:hypothetical protein H1R20_g4192, partial [Candolleomyces eurysporus]